MGTEFVHLRSLARIHSSISDALIAFALCVVFGFAFEWLFIALGMFAGGAQTAQDLGYSH